MTPADKDNKYTYIFVVVSLFFFVFATSQLILLSIPAIIVIAVSLKYRKTRPAIAGNMILAFLTLFILFFGFEASVLWVRVGFFFWVLTMGIALSIYGIAVFEVSKYFNIPVNEKLSNMTPFLISSLEVLFPGIGFTYLGKQKGKNYTIIGISIFCTYLIVGLALVFLNLPGIIIFSFIIIFRVITPILAYRTVKKLKGK